VRPPQPAQQTPGPETPVQETPEPETPGQETPGPALAGPEAPGPELAGLTLAELAAAARVPQGTLRRAAELGLLPAFDVPGGRWSPGLARAIQDRWPQTAAAVEAAEDFGVVRCAELLSRLTGLSVRPVHVEELARRGMLQPSRQYRQRPLYRVADIKALAGDPLGCALLAEFAAGPTTG
jgi:hypothetical protein